MSRTILITGAGSGFGKLVAFDLAGKGHNIIATDQVWPQVTALKNEAKAAGLDIHVEKLDVTNARDREHALRHDIDVLFSNAGAMEAGPIAELPIDLLRSMFEVNFFGALELAQGFARKMVEKRSGKIVFNSSMGGLWTVPYAAGYCATKHAIEAVAEGMKAELAPFGIKIATINPGVFGTGFNDRGVDAVSHWYDPEKNFTPPAVFEAAGATLANQLDPKLIIDTIVNVLTSDEHRFRNVYPPETENMIKGIQAQAWDAMS